MKFISLENDLVGYYYETYGDNAALVWLVGLYPKCL
jgi:hypothetical protein